MKKLNTFIVVLCAVLIIANAILIFTLNDKLDQIQAQLAGVRSGMNNLNNGQGSAEIKEKDVFTPSELARYLGIEMSKIYDMIDKAGTDLPYVNIDGEYRFGKEAIDDWLKTNKNIFTSN